MAPARRSNKNSGADEQDEAATKSASPPGRIRRVAPIRDVDDLHVFRFEVGPAILAQLLEKLLVIPPEPISGLLTQRYPGFYQLLLDGKERYIGKTARPIGERLREHVGTLSGRLGIDLATVHARYAFVEDPSLVDIAEGELVSYFAERGMADWNTSGFGSKVPGYGRGRQRASKWAQQFPVDPGLQIAAGHDAPLLLLALIRQVSNAAPITLSVPRDFLSRFRTDHATEIVIPKSERSFSEWVEVIEGHLNADWEIERGAEDWYVVKTGAS